MQKERSQLWTKKAVPSATQCLAVGWRRSSWSRSESMISTCDCYAVPSCALTVLTVLCVYVCIDGCCRRGWMDGGREETRNPVPHPIQSVAIAGRDGRPNRGGRRHRRVSLSPSPWPRLACILTEQLSMHVSCSSTQYWVQYIVAMLRRGLEGRVQSYRADETRAGPTSTYRMPLYAYDSCIATLCCMVMRSFITQWSGPLPWFD